MATSTIPKSLVSDLNTRTSDGLGFKVFATNATNVDVTITIPETTATTIILFNSDAILSVRKSSSAVATLKVLVGDSSFVTVVSATTSSLTFRSKTWQRYIALVSAVSDDILNGITVNVS